MPEIDLPPGKYRWRRPLSKPLAAAGIAVGLAMLGWLYFHPSSGWGYFFAIVVATAGVTFIIAELMRNID